MTKITRALLALAFATGVAGAPVGCSGGVVGGECRQGFGACGGHCLDFRVDAENCGACGNVCPASQMCIDSVCSLGVDGSAGSSNSGGAGGAVSSSGGAGGVGGAAGSGGSALPEAGSGGAGQVDGGDASRGGSGGAGGGAGAGGTDGGPNCIPPFDTPAHCGSCDNACTGTTSICTLGEQGHFCTALCTPPLVQCGQVCVNTDTDEDNCGACGRRCASGICQGGRCVGATAGHEVLFCMDYRTPPASGSPQQLLLGNAVFISPASPVRVLEYTQDTPVGVVNSVKQTLDAIALARVRTYTPTPALTSLAVTNMLSVTNYDVLLVEDQSTAPAGRLATLGSDWAGTIDSFVHAGGTVVVLAGDGGTAEMGDLLSGAGLLTVTGQTSVTGTQVYNRAAGDAIGLNVLTPYRATRETCTFKTSAPDATTSFVVTDSLASAGTLGAPVVVHRVLAP
jgi:hypothetical protein